MSNNSRFSLVLIQPCWEKNLTGLLPILLVRFWKHIKFPLVPYPLESLTISRIWLLIDVFIGEGRLNWYFKLMQIHLLKDCCASSFILWDYQMTRHKLASGRNTNMCFCLQNRIPPLPLEYLMCFLGNVWIRLQDLKVPKNFWGKSMLVYCHLSLIKIIRHSVLRCIQNILILNLRFLDPFQMNQEYYERT
jgi:hypothetical protein